MAAYYLVEAWEPALHILERVDPFMIWMWVGLLSLAQGAYGINTLYI